MTRTGPPSDAEARPAGTGGATRLLRPTAVLTAQVAAGYLALAGLGLLVAPQSVPGFGLGAHAGWALAALLWWGWRALPGVALAGFGLGLSQAWLIASADLAAAWLWAWLTALVAAGQAALGYGLLWRSGQAQRVLESLGSVLRLIAYGALLSGLIGSLASVWAWDALRNGELGVRAWFDGYLAAVLGVLLFAPLSLCWLGRRVPSLGGRGRYLVTPLLTVFLIVALLNFGLARWERQAQDHRLDVIASKLAVGIQDQLQAHEEVIRSIANFNVARPGFSYAEFENFTRGLLVEHPDLLALSFNDLVPQARRAEFERALSRLSPLGTYRITERGPAKRLVPAADRDSHVVVRYITPLTGNETAVGFDIQSEPSRREAVDRALGLWRMTVTAPVRLVQGRESYLGVLELLPVHTVAVEQPGTDAVGFAVGVVRLDQLVSTALRGSPTEGLMLELSDAEIKGERGLLYRASVPGAIAARAWYTTLHIGDRQWMFRVTPTEAFLQRDWIVPGLAGLLSILAVAAVLTVMVDIKGRHALIARRNLEIEQASRRYQRLFEESPQPMWLYHVGTLRVLMANRSAVALHGMSMVDFVGSSMQDLLAPGMPAYWLDEQGQAMRDPYEAHSRHRRRDGSSFEVQLATIPDYSEGRDLQLLVLQDVSEQREQQMRQVLRVLRDTVDDLVGRRRPAEGDANLETLVRDIADLVRGREASRQELANMKYALDQHAIVSCTDLDGRITYANRRFCKISGYNQYELIGRSHRICNSNVHPPEFWADLWQTIRRGQVWHGEICNRKRSGALYWVDAAIVPVFDAAGMPLQYIAIRTDITQSKQVKQQLQLARDQAERANQAKSEFLANMSHEIRTPLNAMLGLVQVLGRTPLEPEQLDILHRIRAAGQVLLSQLSDVLDFSKIEAGQMSLESRPFTLEQVLDSLDGLQRSTALAGGLAFELHAPTLDHALIGDVVRLSQILLNLTSNAIKFTPHGWVRLTVRELERRGAHCRLRFEVADSGIGIAADKLNSLFQPFQQADSSVTRRFGGTGLGLSICKHLVELMGGCIDVTSVEGTGSTFGFDLPFECVEFKPEHDQTDQASLGPGPGVLTHCRVLVVDDNEMNRDMVRRMLHQEGAHVALAVDGQQAIEMLQQHRDEFDLVLMDNQMPVMDGLQATRQIRTALGLTALPVVICSAGVRAEDRERAMAAGATDFMTKPIEREQLLLVLAHALGGRLAPPQPDLALPGSSGIPVGAEVERPPAPAPAALPAGWPVIEGIDAESLVEQLDGDSEYFRQILLLLQRDLAQLLELLPAELAQGQFETVGARLHKLRGAAAMVCAQPLVDACRQLEEALDASAPQRDQAQAAWVACAGQLLARLQQI